MDRPRKRTLIMPVMCPLRHQRMSGSNEQLSCAIVNEESNWTSLCSKITNQIGKLFKKNRQPFNLSFNIV